MGLRAGINRHVLYWVREVEHDATHLGVVFRGSPFLADHGLGTAEGNESPRRVYSGPLALVGREKRVLERVSIAEVHFMRSGFALSVSGAMLQELPAAPFLLTDLDGLEQIFDGEVRILPTEPAADFIRYEGESAEFMVRGEGWIGVLDRCRLGGAHRGHLRAFSDSPANVVQPMTEVEFLDTEGSFGAIDPL
jgi:hypothetical protein